MLVVRGRLKLSVPADAYVRELFALPGVVTAPLSPAIAAAAALFDRALHADPADRILAATAIAYGASLMTRDRRLHAFARDEELALHRLLNRKTPDETGVSWWRQGDSNS